MKGSRAARSERLDLLARPPCGAWMYQQSAASAVTDPTAQLLELADLFGRGLLSQDEFEQHKARVLEP